jgi:hypothetical protein
MKSKFINLLKAQSMKYVPFADAASTELPIGKLLRLSLFQAVIGMVTSLLVGTLNRVMIVELGMAAWLVAMAVAIPVVFAPLRALVGYRSDTHPSALGLKRIPYMWMGTLLMFAAPVGSTTPHRMAGSHWRHPVLRLVGLWHASHANGWHGLGQ